MTFSDSGTDYDSNFGIPGSLTDTTGSPAGYSEAPQERRRVVDAVDRLRADAAVIGSGSVGRSPSTETKPETSLPDTVDAPGPVGLSDPQYVAERRKMLDTVNRLRATG